MFNDNDPRTSVTFQNRLQTSSRLRSQASRNLCWETLANHGTLKGVAVPIGYFYKRKGVCTSLFVRENFNQWRIIPQQKFAILASV